MGLAAFSPDGNWVAFAVLDQGPEEVFVTRFPGPGRRWVASTAGGSEPKWSRDGTELFFRQQDEMMAVPFDPEGDTPVGVPQSLFRLRSPIGAWMVPNYDVTDDGRFVMLVGDQDVPPSQLVIVVNWFEELKQRAPTGR